MKTLSQLVVWGGKRTLYFGHKGEQKGNKWVIETSPISGSEKKSNLKREKNWLVTRVGFEPTPFLNGALNRRLRPLGHLAYFSSCSFGELLPTNGTLCSEYFHSGEFFPFFFFLPSSSTFS